MQGPASFSLMVSIRTEEAKTTEGRGAMRSPEHSVSESGAMRDTVSGSEISTPGLVEPAADLPGTGYDETAYGVPSVSPSVAPSGSARDGEAEGEGSGPNGGSGSGSAVGRVGAENDPAAILAARVGAAIEERKTYPEAARRRGSEGVVRLRLRLSSDGRLIAATLASSSGSSLLDLAALDLAASVFPLDNIVRKELELVLAVRYSLGGKK